MTTRNITVALAALSILTLTTSVGFTQMAAIKKFDYTLLEGKTLVLPKWTEESERIARALRKANKKGDKKAAKNIESSVIFTNQVLRDGIAQSSYDATAYEFADISMKDVYKSKDQSKIYLVYITSGKTENTTAQLWINNPKRRVIAATLINGLDLSEVNDVRLMFNLLNQSLNMAMELEDEDAKNLKGAKSKYKENFLEFYNNIDSKTFLIPQPTGKKAEERYQDLQEATKKWTVSKYKFVTQEEIDLRRKTKDPSSYYWRNINYYTSSPLITYRFNIIVNSENDEVITSFMGTKRLKPATLEEIQKKMTSRAEKYRKQLASK